LLRLVGLQFELGKIVLREALSSPPTPSSAALPASSCFAPRPALQRLVLFGLELLAHALEGVVHGLGFCANCGEVM
jgi:hypothetical protein